MILSVGTAAAIDMARAETGTGVHAPDPSSAALGQGWGSPAVSPAAGVEAGLRSAAHCGPGADVLGVSRVVEIDTTTGPEFGEQYHKTEPKFLEPGEVVLTFDDGPMRRYTLPILDALDEQCVKATFFSVGRMAIADPATLREVARRGHTIGTHTWSHKNLASLSAAAMKREFELGLSAVAAAAGTPIAPFFRFPYLAHGKSSRDYIRSRGIGTFGIHVDSKDFRTKNPGVVLRNVLSQLEHTKKGILLFHDIQPSTAGALSSLLEELKARGFKVVHMVPKDAPITLPEYDAIAEKALKAKSVAAASSPLAERAATWPVSGATDAPPAAAPAPKKPSRNGAQPAKPYDWANPSNDPWQLKAFGHQ
jgi:peptidoglycan/xylan/chitin deacetylase (PgdA/CDA1 family)